MKIPMSLSFDLALTFVRTYPKENIKNTYYSINYNSLKKVVNIKFQ